MAQTTVDLVRSGHTARTADEILRAPVAALLGVSAAAAGAVGAIGIFSVFDLAASRVFSTARRLAALASDTERAEPESRLGIVLGETVEVPDGVEVADLAGQSIAILRAIGTTHEAAIASALDVTTVRDLALWPPSLAARAILSDAFFPEQADGFDPDAPADLLPRTGNYPTERTFYRTLLIDGPLATPPNAHPIEQLAEAVDISASLLNPTGYQQMATGALLTFSQSWSALGLTLGQLLHSIALAPGESTRMALVDWTRRNSASASDSIDESDRLSNTQMHGRALTEVTEATSSEVQSGKSETTANSTTTQKGGGAGLEIGPLALGGSASKSTTTTDVVSSSSSFGERNMAANYAQHINDRTQQHASSSRSRRASIVREVSQSEHESISTRVVTNYNHMHALSVQYYEVVQAFRTTTQLDRAERCVFIPVRLLDFSSLDVVDRWRLELGAAALSPAVSRALAELGTVCVVSVRPRSSLINTALLSTTVFAGVQFMAMAAPAAPAQAAKAADGTSGSVEIGPLSIGGSSSSGQTSPGLQIGPLSLGGSAAGTVKPSASRIIHFAQAGWQLDQIDRLGQMAGRLTVPARVNTAYLSDDALLLGVALRSGKASAFAVERRDGTNVSLVDVISTRASLAAPTAITEVASISIVHDGTTPLATSLTLHLSLFGTVATLDVPIELAAGGAGSDWQECVRIELPSGTRDLLDHLQANALHYTQAVMSRLDGPSIATMLARHTFRGLPLAQLVDQRPVAVTSNMLAFRMNMPDIEDSDAPVDPHLQEDVDAWHAFLKRTGLDQPVPKTEMVALPSGGVFAEAVLGRFNSAEKLEMTRFWNWQDSPIPFVASEIAPVQAGTRSLPEDLTPGQLSAPIVSIQNPVALPDPTGMAAVVAAIQNGGAFRDMSGLAQSAATAQAAQAASAAGASAVAKQAAQNLETVMSQNTERLKVAAQLAALMMGIPVAGGGGEKPVGGKGTDTEKGAELERAKKLDAKAEASPEKDAPSLERDVFRAQMGSHGLAIAGKVLKAAGISTDFLPPAPAPQPATRTVGPKQPAPQAVALELQLSSYFTDGTFPSTVELQASVQDVGGKILFSHRANATPSISATLNTSDERLYLDLFYGYNLTWPQPMRLITNSFIFLKAPAGTRKVRAVAWVIKADRTIDVPSGTTPPADDAAMAALLSSQGIDVRKVLTPPVVTPRADGGADITFRLLQKVTLEQLS